jgi:hypothetical protein
LRARICNDMLIIIQWGRRWIGRRVVSPTVGELRFAE